MSRDLLRAFQHADSAFPSGSFAFSNGFEGLLQQGVRLDKDGLAACLKMVARHRWATWDRVAVARAHRASPDLDRFAGIDAELEATSINEPLRIGSRRNGAAFIAAHLRMQTPGALELRDAIVASRAHGHLAAVQGFLWRALGIDEANAVAISGYATVAGLVAVAVRLGQIGALAAQPILTAALDYVAEAAANPVEDDEPLGSFTPFLDVAAIRQSAAHVRLFVT